MIINLPLRSFSFFKVFSGVLVLYSSFLFPLITFVSLLILLVGRAHTLGAWFSMWRANKLSWKYLGYMFIIALGVSFWGFNVVEFSTLAFVSSFLFVIHFLYDEFDLQQQKRTFESAFAIINPATLMFLLLIKDFLSLSISSSIFFILAIILFLIELIYVKEINWFFIQTKILTIFILLSFFLNYNSLFIINLFLVHHYFFWFIYPVYKLHKYKRQERDSFIMMLGIIMIISMFAFSPEIWKGVENIYIPWNIFYISSMVHVLLTAPFGYLFGLSRSRYENT